MIVVGNGEQRRNFLGVDFVLLAHGPKSMVTKMLYKRGDSVPSHKHANEQSGYVISGRFRIRFAAFDQEIGPGDSYMIPENVAHTIEVIEPGEVLDFFAPPRADYL